MFGIIKNGVLKEFQKRMKTYGFIKNLKKIILFSDLFRILSNNSATKALKFNTLHFTLKNLSQEQKSFFKCTKKAWWSSFNFDIMYEYCLSLNTHLVYIYNPVLHLLTKH